MTKQPYSKLIMVLFLIPMVSICVFVPFLPATVPTHYSILGVADDYGSKWTLILLALTGVLVIYWLLSTIKNKCLSKGLQGLVIVLSTIINIISYGIIYGSYHGIDTILPVKKYGKKHIEWLHTSLLWQETVF